jgi:type I restriction enzyme S subunit
MEQQVKIVAALDALQSKLDSVKALQAETAVELDAMLPAILDKAFKGGL